MLSSDRGTGGTADAREEFRSAQFLLRHVDEPDALRTVPFLCALIGEPGTSDASGRVLVERCLERLRSDVGPAVTERDRRGVSILERCDLAGETRERVARDLGLSRRQFYRERHNATLRVAAQLAAFARERVAERTADGCHAYDVAAYEFERARTLAEAGEYDTADRALATFDQLPTVERCEALRLRVEADALRGRYARAAQTLERLERLAQADYAHVPAARLQTAVARAALASRESGVLDARAFAAQVETEAATVLRTGRVRDIALVAEARAHAATYALESGDARGASAAIDGAERAARLLEERPVYLVALLLVVRGTTAFCSSTDGSGGAQDARRALDYAQRHGLVRLRIEGELLAAMRERIAGAETAAMAHAETAANLSRRFALDGSEADALMFRASVFGERGDVGALQHVLERARTLARARASPSFPRFQACARLLAGDLSGAAALADIAVERAARLGHVQYVGVGLTVKAQILSALGRIGEAREAIESSITVLESSGFLVGLHRAYGLATALGDDDRSRRARRHDVEAAVAAP